MNAHNLLVFTDMDGSLLDHYSYSHAAADKLLSELELLGIPVIANTSKTRAELEQLRKELNNNHPFIAENGAAVFLPKHIFEHQPPTTKSGDKYWIKEFAAQRPYWQQLIAEEGAVFSDCFVTFEQAGVDGIVEMTGLSPDQARLAANREYGEPLRWNGTDEQAAQFFEQLEKRGARVLRGGRFIHVSDYCDKGAAMLWLAEQYNQLRDLSMPCQTLALGDSQNDVAMLDAADYAVIIKSPVHPAPNLHTKEDKLKNVHLHYSEACGPEGWVEGVSEVLRSLGIDNN